MNNVIIVKQQLFFPLFHSAASWIDISSLRNRRLKVQIRGFKRKQVYHNRPRFIKMAGR